MLGLRMITHRSDKAPAHLSMTSSDITVEPGIAPYDIIACSAISLNQLFVL